MTTVIIFWAYIAFLTFVYGLVAVSFFHKAFSFEEDVSFPVVSILGLCLISTIVGFISIFSKIGLLANLIVFGLGLVFTKIEYKNISRLFSVYLGQIKNTKKPVLLLFAFSFVTILLKASSPTTIYDTGLYHAQAIKWIETYKAVPGLGNFHTRLAFNSSWFLPSALFSFSFLNLHPFCPLNSIFVLLVTVFLLNGPDKLLKKQYTLSAITESLICFSLFAYLFNRRDLSSLSLDIPSMMLAWLLFLIFLRKVEKGEHKKFDINSVVIVIFSLFSLVIKLSVAPLILLSVYIAYNERSKGKTLAVIAGSAFVIILPWCVRNIILSGYLIYPFPGIDIFNFDWKIPIENVVLTKKIIESWARIPAVHYDIVQNMPFSEWVPIWFKGRFASDKLILLTLLSCSSFYLAYFLFNVKKLSRFFKEGCVVLYFTLYASVFFWFKMAPAPRFGHGFLITLCALLVAPLLKPLFNRRGKITSVSLFTVLLAFQLTILYRALDVSVICGRVLFTPT